MGIDGFEQLLGQIIQTAMRSAVMRPKAIERVNVDTTVQEKAVAFPTDARLYHQARITLVRAARKRGVKLCQSYINGSDRIRRAEPHSHIAFDSWDAI